MGKSNMSRRYRQRIGLLSLGVLGLMGLSASNFRGNEPPAVTAGAPSRPAVPGPLASEPAQAPAFLGVAAAFPRHRYIVQAQSADAARAAVSRAGGVVSTDLSIIRAVAAALDEREMSTLRAQNVPQLHIYDDSAVVASSMGTLPETYYPSEVDAANLHLGGMTGRGVTVAVIDSGLWSNQGPLQSAPGESRSRIIAQYDVILARQNPHYYLPSILESYSRNISDAYGHGTHVTSVIASSGVATTGRYQGVAPGVNLVSVRALDSNGNGLYSDVINAVQWVIGQRQRFGIRVLNLSLGAPPSGPYWQDPLNQAVMAAWASGIVVVTAAGNRGPDALSINAPGNVPYVITVGAVTDNWYPMQASQYRLDSFSSTGPTLEGFVKPDVLGMGGHITAYAPDNGTLAHQYPSWFTEPYSDMTMSGTSQAAATVTGVVALMLQVNPSLTPDQVKCRLMSGAHPAVNASGDLAYSVFQQGAGLVDAHDAAYSTATGCANQGINVLLDLAGLQHYGGRANEDANGNFYIMQVTASATPLRSLLSSVFTLASKLPLVGGLLKDIPLLGDGLLWNGAYTSSSGYHWSEGYAWSEGYHWSEGYAWSEGYHWSEGYAWSEGYTGVDVPKPE
jgi:serine protease AprX